MTGYRLYFIGEDGRIFKAAEVECESDSEAREWACRQDKLHALELWSGPRVIASFPPPDRKAQVFRRPLRREVARSADDRRDDPSEAP